MMILRRFRISFCGTLFPFSSITYWVRFSTGVKKTSGDGSEDNIWFSMPTGRVAGKKRTPRMLVRSSVGAGIDDCKECSELRELYKYWRGLGLRGSWM